MTLLRDPKHSGTPALWIAGFLFFCLFLGFFLYGGSFVRGAFATLIAGAPSLEHASLSRSALSSRLADAERELTRTRYQALLYVLVAEENKKLREATGASEAPAGIVGRVLSRPPRTHYDTLLLDVGVEQGVSVHDLVIFEGVALGTIVTVDSRTSVVSLFSTPGSETDVIIGTPRAVAVARGLGGGAYEVSVPQGITIAPTDIVRVSATESLVLGIVSDVSLVPADVLQTVRFRTPLALADLDFVRIISSTPSEKAELAL